MLRFTKAHSETLIMFEGECYLCAHFTPLGSQEDGFIKGKFMGRCDCPSNFTIKGTIVDGDVRKRCYVAEWYKECGGTIQTTLL